MTGNYITPRVFHQSRIHRSTGPKRGIPSIPSPILSRPKMMELICEKPASRGQEQGSLSKYSLSTVFHHGTVFRGCSGVYFLREKTGSSD